MAQGTVKGFNADKARGFIAPGDGTPGLPVHRSAIEADGDRIPRTASTSWRSFLTAGDGAERD